MVVMLLRDNTTTTITITSRLQVVWLPMTLYTAHCAKSLVCMYHVCIAGYSKCVHMYHIQPYIESLSISTHQLWFEWRCDISTLQVLPIPLTRTSLVSHRSTHTFCYTKKTENGLQYSRYIVLHQTCQ